MIKYNIYHSHKRANKQGEAPIYFRIKLENTILEKSTGIFIGQKQFDKAKKRIIGNNKEAFRANQKLDEMEAHLCAMDKNVVATTIEKINYLFETVLTDQAAYSIESLIKLYIEHLKSRINNNQANQILPVTFKKNQFLAKSVLSYLVETKRQTLTWKEIDRIFISCFINYSINVRGFSVGHVNRLVKFIKSVLRNAIDEGLAEHTSALSVKLKSEQKPILYLDKNQIKQIEQISPLTEKLEKVRDLFFLQCFTGLSYSDLMKFTNEWVYTDANGNYFMKYQRQKNQKPATVPILPKTMQILNKYNGAVPKISNQKYNDYLKVIGMAANLPFPLTSHIGRKTCGSLLLNTGVSIFTVKTILGHASVKTTEQHYASLNESGIMLDLSNTGKLRVANRLNRSATQTMLQFA